MLQFIIWEVQVAIAFCILAAFAPHISVATFVALLIVVAMGALASLRGSS